MRATAVVRLPPLVLLGCFAAAAGQTWPARGRPGGTAADTIVAPKQNATPFEYALELAPASLTDGFHNESMQSWGGSILKDEDTGLYHMWTAAFTQGCSLSGWQQNSEVVHSVSQHRTGPFIMRDVALPIWHHGPQAIRAPDGMWMLFARGKENPSSEVPCDKKTHRPECGKEPAKTCPGNPSTVWLHASKLPNGPWRRIAPICSGCDNAAPIFLANGSLVVVHSDCETGVAQMCPAAPNGTDSKRNETIMLDNSLRMWFAESWDGPHLSLRGVKSFVGRVGFNPYTSFNATEHVCQAGSRGLLAQEDPVVWQGKDGRFRMLIHQFDCRTLRAWGAVGGYAISKTDNIFGEWDYDYKLAGYNATVQLANGRTVTVARRERPKVLLEDGVPTVLTNGVCLETGDRQCFTLAQRIVSMKSDDAVA